MFENNKREMKFYFSDKIALWNIILKNLMHLKISEETLQLDCSGLLIIFEKNLYQRNENI